MAALTTATSNINSPVNFVLMKALLSAARKKLPFFNGTLSASMQKEGNGAASVKWRRIENLTAVTTALSEVNGTAAAFLGRDAVRPTYTDITATVQKYGNAVLTTEEMDLYQVNSKTVDFVDTLGANAGESLNRLMEVVYAGATTIRYSGSAAPTTTVTVSSAITLNDIKNNVNLLNAGSAMKFTTPGYGSVNVGTSPVRSSYYGICHVDVEEDIRLLSGFIPVEQYGGYTETMPFEFGAVGGVRFCSTEIIPILSDVSTVSTTGLRGTSTALHNVYPTYIYGKEAVGSVSLGNTHATTAYEMYDPQKPPAVELIIHPKGSSGIFDMYNEMGSVAWKTYFAGQILNASWISKVYSASTRW